MEISIQNREGNTPLHVAVIRKSPIDVVETLLRHDHYNVSIANNEGMTPLQIVARDGSLNIMVQKCSREDIQKMKTKDISGVLCNAVFQNCAAVVQAIVVFQREKVNLRYSSDCPEDTLLHVAWRNRHCEIMQILLENGADVQAIDSNGDAPIYIVCQGLNLRCLKVLLGSRHCNPNQQNRHGDTVLHIAARSKLKSGERIQCILDSGRCDPNITNKQGYTPLHTAIVNSQFDSVKNVLNSTKCDPNIQDDNGDTALHMAVCSEWKNSAEMTQCILDCDRCDPNITNKQGYTPLHIATKINKCYSVLKLLNLKKCNPNIQDLQGNTALHLSICQMSAIDIEHFLGCKNVWRLVFKTEKETHLYM